MEKLYKYITDRIEEIKYGSVIVSEAPDFECKQNIEQQVEEPTMPEENFAQAEVSLSEEQRKERLEQMAEYRSRGLCQHCGGEFKGITKKCSKCGISKNY